MRGHQPVGVWRRDCNKEEHPSGVVEECGQHNLDVTNFSIAWDIVSLFIPNGMNLEPHLSLHFLSEVFLELSYHLSHLYNVSWSQIISNPVLPFMVDVTSSLCKLTSCLPVLVRGDRGHCQSLSSPQLYTVLISQAWLLAHSENSE